MKTYIHNNLYIIVYLLIIFCVISCSKDDEPASVEIVKSNSKQITNFKFLSANNTILSTDVTANIDTIAKTITATLPVDTPLTTLTPTIDVSAKASFNPTGEQDFTNPVTYTVSAEDGSTNSFEVTLVSNSSAKQITSFVFLVADNTIVVDVTAIIDEENKTIKATVPMGTTVIDLSPTIEISDKATINPIISQDFTTPVVYTVTAEDGSEVVYTVSVKVPSTQKDALQAILDDNPENTLDWDLAITPDSDLGSLNGVDTDVNGNITGLFIGFKNISELPSEIVLLSHLELFVLDGNPIIILPSEIGQLTTLIGISLKGNQLTSLPKEIGFLSNLESLQIIDNPLTTIPPEIGLLLNLSRLDLINNQITSLPPEIGFLINLSALFINESNLTTIPSSFSFLLTLNNALVVGPLPPSSTISPKDALISIYSANPGNTLGWSVDNYPEVGFDTNGNPKTITINNKNITKIPDNIDQQLTGLETLNVNNNNLEAIPSSIGNINTLVVLTLANNQLSTVPSELGQLTSLGLLSLTNNPISSIPAEVCDLQTSNGGILTILSDPGEGCN
ncbi:hypothetical protein [Aquimarina macrocephali]|uniref:leucine-rich repeat domain-containing protein n=1 Tax=Aquimarina macrocephali TaxID=666563 RepID=UPI003F673B59